jgi:hypothetical protein
MLAMKYRYALSIKKCYKKLIIYVDQKTSILESGMVQTLLSSILSAHLNAKWPIDLGLDPLISCLLCFLNQFGVDHFDFLFSNCLSECLVVKDSLMGISKTRVLISNEFINERLTSHAVKGDLKKFKNYIKSLSK